MSIGAPRQNGNYGQRLPKRMCRWCGGKRQALPSGVLICPQCDHSYAVPNARGTED